jgi:hypothetical protein
MEYKFMELKYTMNHEEYNEKHSIRIVLDCFGLMHSYLLSNAYTTLARTPPGETRHCEAQGPKQTSLRGEAEAKRHCEAKPKQKKVCCFHNKPEYIF